MLTVVQYYTKFIQLKLCTQFPNNGHLAFPPYLFFMTALQYNPYTIHSFKMYNWGGSTLVQCILPSLATSAPLSEHQLDSRLLCIQSSSLLT